MLHTICAHIVCMYIVCLHTSLETFCYNWEALPCTKEVSHTMIILLFVLDKLIFPIIVGYVLYLLQQEHSKETPACRLGFSHTMIYLLFVTFSISFLMLFVKQSRCIWLFFVTFRYFLYSSQSTLSCFKKPHVLSQIEDHQFHVLYFYK